MRSHKVIILILDAGGGHRSVARAIQAGMQKKLGIDSAVKIVEISQLPGTWTFINIPGMYARLTRNFLPLYDFSWHLSNHPFAARQIARMVYPFLRRALHATLQDEAPDLVIAGNAFLCDLLALARSELDQNFRIIVVVSDLATIHASWSGPQADLTFVPTGGAKERLLHLGISPGRLAEIDFPVHPRFLDYRVSQEQARAGLGLETERFTLLVTSGGVGSGRMVSMVRSLGRRFPEHQWLVVTGSNQKAYRRLSAEAQNRPLRLYGLVQNMEDLITASDLVITKAGPSTMMECLALDRPMIITGAVGAQEKGNMDLLIKDPRVFLAKSMREMIQVIAAGAAVNTEISKKPTLGFDGAAQIAAVLSGWMDLERQTESPSGTYQPIAAAPKSL